MPKVRGPLFSLRAWGTLGKAISYRGQPFGAQVEKKPKKRDYKSAAQLSRRALFLAGAAYWNGLRAEEKAEYNQLAAGLAMTGFNLCMQDYLLGRIAVGVDVEESGVTKVAGATTLDFLSGFAVADEGGGKAGISLDVDESPLSGLAKLSGRGGGQTLIGGDGEGEHLTLQSTAHATRGYVRAQDDLQLLSNMLRDSGGSTRITLATSSPHVTIDDDLHVSGNLGVGLAPESIYLASVRKNFGSGSGSRFGLGVDVSFGSSDFFGSVFGLYGFARHTGSGLGSYVRGLDFQADVQSSATAASITATGVHVRVKVASGGTFTMNQVFGISLAPSLSKAVTTAYGIYVPNFGTSGGTTVYGLYIADQTGSTNKWGLFQTGITCQNALNANTQFGSTTPSFGGGVGVIGLANAATVPSSNPSGGGVAYAEAGRFKWRRPDGTIDVLGDGGASDGWHGSTTRIKLLPTDFTNTDYSIGYGRYITSSGGAAATYTGAGTYYFAIVAIPAGFKATHVRVYTSLTDADGLTVYEGQIDNATAVSRGGPATTASELDITDVTSTTTNYLIIRVDENAGNVYGGYVTIAAV